MHIYAKISISYTYFAKISIFNANMPKYVYKYTTPVVLKYNILLPLLTGFLSKKYHFLSDNHISLKICIFLLKNRWPKIVKSLNL